MLNRLAISLLILSGTFLPLFSQGTVQDEKLLAEIAKFGQAEVVISYPGRTEIDILTRYVSITSVKNKEVFITLSSSSSGWFISRKFNYRIVPQQDSKGIVTATDLTQAMDWQSYPGYTDYVAIMQTFAANYPSICKLDTIGTSINGKLVLALKISDNVNMDEPEPEVFYSSSIHGDELGGFVLMLRLADSLLSCYSTSARIKTMVDDLEIWINPLANPDGTYRPGNTISGAVRSNSNGIDLNRNFPDPFYPSIVPEKENVDMMKFMRKHRFVISANFHGGAEVVNYPWDRWLSKYHADDAWFNSISRAYADTVHKYSATGYLTGINTGDNGVTRGAVWYVIYGGRQDFITWELQGREVTIELDYTKWTPSAQLDLLWRYNRRSLLDYLENARYGIHGLVRDEGTLVPVAARVFIYGHDKDSSQIYSDTLTGHFTRMLSSGSWNLTFSAKGYRDTTVSNIVVSAGQRTNITVNMKPLTTAIDTTDPETPVLFPNPAGSEIKCLLPYKMGGNIAIAIYSQSGKKVAGYNTVYYPGDLLRIDLQGFPAGMYFASFHSIAGGVTCTSKFIKTGQGF
jgi:hypothetical protein